MKLLAALAIAILAVPLLAHPSPPLTDPTEVSAQHSSLLPRGRPMPIPVYKNGATDSITCPNPECKKQTAIRITLPTSNKYQARCDECKHFLELKVGEKKWVDVGTERPTATPTNTQSGGSTRDRLRSTLGSTGVGARTQPNRAPSNAGVRQGLQDYAEQLQIMEDSNRQAMNEYQRNHSESQESRQGNPPENQPRNQRL